MRKPYKIWLMVAGLLELCLWANAQTPVNQAMATQLRKAEKQLTQSLKKLRSPKRMNMHGYVYLGQETNTTAAYIKGYGVVITLPRVMLGVRSRRVRRNRKTGKLYVKFRGNTRVALDKSKYNINDRVVHYMRSGSKPDYKYTLVDRNEVVKKRKADLKAAMKSFLAKASGLMALLTGSEKIELVYDHHNKRYYQSRNKKYNVLMPRFLVASIDKQTWSNNPGKVTFSKETRLNTTNQSLEVMSGIIEGLFKRSVSQSFQGYNRVRYHQLGDMGVLYSLQLNQRISASHDEKYVIIKDNKVIDSDSIRARKSGNYAQVKAERQQAYRKAYQRFEQEIKQYLVEYGKVLQGIAANKWLVLHVSLPKMWYTKDDPSVPHSVQVSVKAGVLQNVKAGRMTAENAQSQVVLQKY
ncbi:hypothetical protein [uncultured Microscilla sp.]|uniref:hypothetical protein n=1 Tax=uncultured Microscilla sp. TaxID=432653 RepID=UPI002606B55D|nr:hypothetical protein [uncultured Microscilla sp.]